MQLSATSVRERLPQKFPLFFPFDQIVHGALHTHLPYNANSARFVLHWFCAIHASSNYSSSVSLLLVHLPANMSSTGVPRSGNKRMRPFFLRVAEHPRLCYRSYHPFDTAKHFSVVQALDLIPKRTAMRRRVPQTPPSSSLRPSMAGIWITLVHSLAFNDTYARTVPNWFRTVSLQDELRELRSELQLLKQRVIRAPSATAGPSIKRKLITVLNEADVNSIQKTSAAFLHARSTTASTIAAVEKIKVSMPGRILAWKRAMAVSIELRSLRRSLLT